MLLVFVTLFALKDIFRFNSVALSFPRHLESSRIFNRPAFKKLRQILWLSSTAGENSNNNQSDASPLSWIPSQSSLVPFGIDSPRNDQPDDRFFQRDYSVGIIPVSPNDLDTSKPIKDIQPDKPFSAESQKYFNLIQKLAPNDMIAKFAQTAPKQVQEAAKSTIMTLFGSMPSYVLDAALITTNTKLANLLFQMQITGYMFKNAEYRMSLTRSLKGLPRVPEETVLKQNNITFRPLKGDSVLNGKFLVTTTTGEKVEVDVNELTTALSNEISSLRSELDVIRTGRERELRSNLLTYIQALNEKDLSKLTADMSPDVMDSIRMLVNSLMEKMGVDNTSPQEVVIQQSVTVLAQICMWQLVTGYKLREYEALDKGVPLD